ncbi:hypothetical protein ACIFQM_11920 [Paenibacillus sp. NRS-1782]
MGGKIFTPSGICAKIGRMKNTVCENETELNEEGTGANIDETFYI